MTDDLATAFALIFFIFADVDTPYAEGAGGAGGAEGAGGAGGAGGAEGAGGAGTKGGGILNAFKGFVVASEKYLFPVISGKAAKSCETGDTRCSPALAGIITVEASALLFFKKNSLTAPAPKPTIANANGTIGFPSTAKATKGLPPPLTISTYFPPTGSSY